MMVGNGLTSRPHLEEKCMMATVSGTNAQMEMVSGTHKCMMGNGHTGSSRGKATLSGTKAHMAMVSRTCKCMMVIVCRTHPEEKKMCDG